MPSSVNSVPEVLRIWQAAPLRTKKAHLAVKVQFDYLDHEEFKSKLPMLLQSDDITDAIAGDFKDSFYPAGVQAFMSQGRSYGLPDSVGPIVFWYNKELCEKAGVDPREIKYWEDFLAVEVALTDARDCIVRAPFDGRVVGLNISAGAFARTAIDVKLSITGLPVVKRELDWVQLAQDFPVRIRFTESVPPDLLRVGAIATATIFTRPDNEEW